MKSDCEQCRAALAHSSLAYICSYECTFCSSCTEQMERRCPNCKGELLARPRRVSAEATATNFVAKHKVHRYAANCTWEGQTGLGYEKYVRAHRVAVPPAEAALNLSSDPGFRGDAKLINPEQLVVAAASSCQLLSFLAVAARAGVDVRRYDDEAEGEMPEAADPIRITRIRLRPRIEVNRGPSEAKVRDVVRLAHDECYIASSLKTEVNVEPTIVFV
jgi:organic hydroperoxide reductase OsmC/OhrA